MPHWFGERRRSRAPHRADVIHVVGLGPDDERFLTADALEHLTRLPARLRTRRHPAAAGFGHLDSYDEWYDEAEDFESLYRDIVADVVAWHDATDSDVTYGVPGSPLVAEHTVELLLASGVPIKIHPAVSVIDVVISALGVDPMTQRVRILDALDMPTLDGPGPWLILQVYSPEIAALVADALPRDAQVTVCWHAGAADESITIIDVNGLSQLDRADHLTSLWVSAPSQRGATDLMDLMHQLRRECPWDQDQTHQSLERHLIEEAYEVVDALSHYDELSGEGSEHVEEELGDLFFQILFHAELGSEVDAFTLPRIMTRIHDKLVSRHPHVFGDASMETADDVARQWEGIKKKEKQRESVTDGVAMGLPGFVLWAKMARKRRLVFDDTPDVAADRAELAAALDHLATVTSAVDDATIDGDASWDRFLHAVAAYAQVSGIDIDGTARRLALRIRHEIRQREGLSD